MAERLDTITIEDTTAIIALSGSDDDGDPLTFTIVGQPSHGVLNALTSTGRVSATVQYTPDADFNGQDSFTFKVNDGSLDSGPALVSTTVLPVPDTPVAEALSVSTDEDAPVTIQLSGTDADGDSLVFSVSITPQHGSLSSATSSGTTTATVVYTPSADFNGPDSFVFAVTDGSLSATATVTVTVTPVNDVPETIGQRVSTDKDTPVTITVRYRCGRRFPHLLGV